MNLINTNKYKVGSIVYHIHDKAPYIVTDECCYNKFWISLRRIHYLSNYFDLRQLYNIYPKKQLLKIGVKFD